jgi:hypothetical protein
MRPKPKLEEPRWWSLEFGVHYCFMFLLTIWGTWVLYNVCDRKLSRVNSNPASP